MIPKTFQPSQADRRYAGLIEIHTAVFLFGLAGLFGKFLIQPPLVIVLGRTLFAAITLAILLVIWKMNIRLISISSVFLMILSGIILAVHWVAFFKSIQISTVAVGLLTYSTFPMFVTFLEPFFFRERLRLVDLITGCLVLAGLVLVIPAFDFKNQIMQGVLWGTGSGFTFAILSLINRKMARSHPAAVVAFYQNGIAAVVLFPFLVLSQWSVSGKDLVLLGVLGIFCTALAHALFIRSLKYLKTQLAAVIACLEPVYGIFFAVLILREIPGVRTLLGGAVILGAVTLATIRRKPI
jgi:drug/metabolite transporter (DMT)-like permease